MRCQGKEAKDLLVCGVMKKVLFKFNAGLPTLVNVLKGTPTDQSNRENPSQLSPEICLLVILDPAKSTVELNTVVENFWFFYFPGLSFRDFLKLFLIYLSSVLRSFSERWNASISEETAHNLSSSEAR